jgi:hypothetical protein
VLTGPGSPIRAGDFSLPSTDELEAIMTEGVGRRGVLLGGLAVPLGVLAAGVPAQAASAATSDERTAAPVRVVDAGRSRALPAAKGAFDVSTGVQFSSTLQAGQSTRFVTFGWPAAWHVIWHAISKSPRTGVEQIDFSTAVERASLDNITYHITVRNLSNEHVDIEGRFAILSQ